MLHEFLTRYRDDIVARAAHRASGRVPPSLPCQEIEHGVPMFLTQLTETLRLEGTPAPFSGDSVGASAAKHGEELLAAGFSVGQVVHDYGDVCQAITEIAVEQHAPITVEEFHTLNRCIDSAIAEAVSAHARLSAAKRSNEELERVGGAAHELRDLLNSALLAFDVLKRGTVAVNGSTGAVLDRSLTGLRDVIGRTLSDVRLAAGQQRHDRLNVATLVGEIAATARLHSEYRDIRFTVLPVDTALEVNGDALLLTSAVMNLLLNGFKSTPAGGSVLLEAHADGDHLLIDVQDECGGMAASQKDPFRPFGERRGSDRSGLGLGLSIAHESVRAHGGDIRVRNIPGEGCVFTVDLPLAGEALPLLVS